MGILIPLFWTSGDVCPGFQSQGGSLACFLACVIPRFTSDSPADWIYLPYCLVAKTFRSKAEPEWPSGIQHCACCMRTDGRGFEPQTSTNACGHVCRYMDQESLTAMLTSFNPSMKLVAHKRRLNLHASNTLRYLKVVFE